MSFLSIEIEPNLIKPWYQCTRQAGAGDGAYCGVLHGSDAAGKGTALMDMHARCPGCGGGDNHVYVGCTPGVAWQPL